MRYCALLVLGLSACLEPQPRDGTGEPGADENDPGSISGPAVECVTVAPNDCVATLGCELVTYKQCDRDGCSTYDICARPQDDDRGGPPSEPGWGDDRCRPLDEIACKDDDGCTWEAWEECNWWGGCDERSACHSTGPGGGPDDDEPDEDYCQFVDVNMCSYVPGCRWEAPLSSQEGSCVRDDDDGPWAECSVDSLEACAADPACQAEQWTECDDDGCVDRWECVPTGGGPGPGPGPDPGQDCWPRDEEHCEDSDLCKWETWTECGWNGCYDKGACVPAFDEPGPGGGPGPGPGPDPVQDCLPRDEEHCEDSDLCNWETWTECGWNGCEERGACVPDPDAMGPGGGGGAGPGGGGPGNGGGSDEQPGPVPPAPWDGCWDLDATECAEAPGCHGENWEECGYWGCEQQFHCYANGPAYCGSFHHQEACEATSGCAAETYEVCDYWWGCHEEYRCSGDGSPSAGTDPTPEPQPDPWAACEELGAAQCEERPDCWPVFNGDAFASCSPVTNVACDVLSAPACAGRLDCKLEGDTCVAREITWCGDIDDAAVCDMVPGCVAAYGSSCAGCGDSIFLGCIARDPCRGLGQVLCNLAPGCAPEFDGNVYSGCVSAN